MTRLLRPLFNKAAGVAMQMLFGEFHLGYDTVVGYLLAHEELLHSHDHGHPFSLDKSLDRELKDAVKRNLSDASRALATLKLDWPQLCTALNTFKAARQILNAGKAQAEELRHHGAMHEVEAERLFDLIAERATRLAKLDPRKALPAAQRDDFIPDRMHSHSTNEIDMLEAWLSQLRGRESFRLGGSSASPPPGTPTHRVV